MGMLRSMNLNLGLFLAFIISLLVQNSSEF
jgi:hypothetical protein